ncbi:hypothetical protein KRM28CT15_45210 [Krasilnikovia sp. M28-CT-15]
MAGAELAKDLTKCPGRLFERCLAGRRALVTPMVTTTGTAGSTHRTGN